MVPQNERRRWPRSDSKLPEVGILYFGRSGFDSQPVLEDLNDTIFVDLLNKTWGGALIKAPQKIEVNSTLYLQVFNSELKSWEFFPDSRTS